MFALIHSISNNIIYRKSLKWKNISSDDHETFECTDIYQQMESFMNKSLNKLTCNKTKLTLIEKCLQNVLSVKNNLDRTPWSIPWQLKEADYSVFLKDLDFYLMISGLLLKSCSLFKGFIPKRHCPPISKILPLFASNSKKVQQTISQLPNSKWIQTIHFYQQNNEYISALEQLEIQLRKPNYNKDAIKLTQLVFETFSVWPETRLDESYKTKAIKELNKHFKYFNAIPKQISHKEWKAIRYAITTLLLYAEDTETVTHIYYSTKQCLIANNEFNNKEEKHFFKKQIEETQRLLTKKIEVNAQALYTMTDIFEELDAITGTHKQENQEAYIEWCHNPKVFVKSIQSAINNGYIKLKGNTDTKPIIELISTFVKVKKQNKTGNLTFDSLLSYFKKASTGDL